MAGENKSITLDGLAGMIKRGFDHVDEKLDKVEARLGGRLGKVEAKLDNLETGVEEIKLKLDQVAYRFEVQELDRRLKLVETKLGIK